MTMPRVLSLSTDGALIGTLAPEVEALRGSALDVSAPLPLAFELRATVEVRDEITGFALRSAANGEMVARVGYDPRAATLFFEGVGCAPTDLTSGGMQQAPLALAPGERLDLRVFVDHSVVEIFANGRVALSGRMYPEADCVVLGSMGDVRSMQAWEMKAIW
jgi:beta-fructofuranosidase